MSTTAPVVPVAPAAASPTPPPVAPAAPPADTKAMASQLFKLLADTKDTPREEPKAPAAPATPEPVAAPAAPPEKPIKLRKPKAVVDEPPPIPKPEPAAPVVAAPAAPARQTDDEFEKDLVEEEREQLETARFAEKKFPDKYKGLADKTRKFLKEHAEKVSAPDFDEEDSSYQKWVKENMPKLSPVEVRKIDQERIREQVTKDSDSKYDNLRHEMYARDEEPKIRQVGNKIHQELANLALPEEVQQAFAAKHKELGDAKKAVEIVQAEYALEFEIADNIVREATADIEEFHRLTTRNPQTGRNLKELDQKNPQHERILGMVSHVCEEFKAEGGDALKKDGKWFATRQEWLSIPPDQRKNWWTFDNEEIIARAKKQVPLAVKFTVDAERKRLEQRGFTRQPRVTPPAASAAPVPPVATAPAAPRPSPVPGAGQGMAPSMGAILAQRLQSQKI